MKKRIHVNQHNIRHNAKHPESPKPVLTVKTYKENIKCDNVYIAGPSQVVFRPDKPLSCGAKVWIETEASILAINEHDEGEEDTHGPDNDRL